MLHAVLLSAPLLSQDLDETWIVTVNGRSVTANPDGSFFIGNVPVIDQFGPDGPGSLGEMASPMSVGEWRSGSISERNGC